MTERRDRPAHTASADDQLARIYGGEAAQRLYDESVTELEHALQAAALAEAANGSDALVAAALLHDIGHLIVDDLVAINEVLDRDAEHEKAGARCLRRWFDVQVTSPVALHVAAKRYLCGTDPVYTAGLSPSSVRSLAVQGGPMTAQECVAFEQRPGWSEAVQLRRWDDLAKVPGAPTRSFADYRGLLAGLAASL